MIVKCLAIGVRMGYRASSCAGAGKAADRRVRKDSASSASRRERTLGKSNKRCGMTHRSPKDFCGRYKRGVPGGCACPSELSPPCRDESLQESPVWNSEELVRLLNQRTAGVAA